MGDTFLPTFKDPKKVGSVTRKALFKDTNLNAPTFQGSTQVNRLRQQGASLQPGEGFGTLGSIQAGGDPDAFNNLLLQLLRNPNNLSGL